MRAQRSRDAALYRALYKTKQWRALREQQLTKAPWCTRCLARGVRQKADTVHHTKAHKGNPLLFWDPTNLESVCRACHDGRIQSEERLGYARDIGIDGWPIDPRDPRGQSGAGGPKKIP
jgi:5-methylcytosine-specific restriction enzyme A